MGPSMTDVSRSMRQQMEENDHSKRKTKQVFFEDMSLLTIGGEIANNISICFCIWCHLFVGLFWMSSPDVVFYLFVKAALKQQLGLKQNVKTKPTHYKVVTYIHQPVLPFYLSVPTKYHQVPTSAALYWPNNTK